MSAVRRRRSEAKAAGIPVGHCKRTGKRRWARRADARTHLRNLKAAGDKRAALLGTYRCDHCQAWHVGHRTKDASS